MEMTRRLIWIIVRGKREEIKSLLRKETSADVEIKNP